MRLLQAGAMAMLLVVFCAAGGWAQGNSCEENIDAGNGGCLPAQARIAHGTGAGGIDFDDPVATEYAGTCATGTGGCTVNQPIMRFWETDAFGAKNSAVHPQNVSPSYWMQSLMGDFGIGSDPGHWVFFQANWGNDFVQGCVSSGRTTAEVSFCDSVSNEAYYVIGSVPLAGGSYEFENITGANGADGSILPLTQVPVPTINSATEAGTDCNLNVTIGPAARWWTDAGAGGDPALIAGYEILYFAGTPTAGCSTGLGAWMPVQVSGGGSNLGAQPAGTYDITVPSTGTISISARVVYADAAAGCNPGNCLDPQGSGAPASCFMNFNTEACGGGPVTWGETSVMRLSGNTAKVAWSTLEETDTFGFKVMRAEAGSDSFLQVGGIVYAQGPGHAYTLEDTNALRSESYDYKIVEIAFAGDPSVSALLRLEGISEHGKRVRILHGENER